MTKPADKKTPAKRIVGDGTPGPGRPKGMLNKTTTKLKEAILEAAERAGGKAGLVGYLTTQATKNPAHFMSLLGRVLPLTLDGEVKHILPTAAEIKAASEKLDEDI